MGGAQEHRQVNARADALVAEVSFAPVADIRRDIGTRLYVPRRGFAGNIRHTSKERHVRLAFVPLVRLALLA